MSSATYASPITVGEIGAVDEKVLNRQRQLAELPEVDLYREALKALRYELDLPADERRRHVIGRLRAWLALNAQDARRIAVAFEAVLDELEPEERHVIRESEEDAVMDGLSYREFERLAAFKPSLQHWQDSLWSQFGPDRTGMPGSFAAALAIAGMAGEF